MSTETNDTILDTDLINGCIDGNRKMQETLYHRFSSKMFTICLRYSSNIDDAEDLLQDGFIKVFKNLDKFRGDGSFEGWVRRIFVNTSIEHFRKKTRLTTVTDVQENIIEDKEWSAFESLAEKDIIKMIQELSPGYRQVFNMYIIEGFSHKEIGEILGISEGTSKSQLARARVILQKKIEDNKKLN